jgi:hypothetical protein
VLHVLNTTAKSYDLPFEGSDPKVLEFLQILEEYRVKCEEEGNYLEAARAHRQLGVLRKQVGVCVCVWCMCKRQRYAPTSLPISLYLYLYLSLYI